MAAKAAITGDGRAAQVLGPPPGKALRKAVVQASRGWQPSLEQFVTSEKGNINGNINGGGDTLLHLACRHAAGAEVVAELLRLGAGVELENTVGHRALHEAALSGDPSTVRAVLEGAAEVDALKHAGWTPLMLAASKATARAAEVVELLLHHGARGELRNKDGWNALQVATRAGDVGCVRALLAPHHGATGTNPVSPAVATTTAFDSSAITNVAKTATNVSTNGRTPLMTAALHGHCEVLEVLLQLKAVHELLETRDSCGQTALHSAVIGGSAGAVRVLLRAGAALEARDTGLAGVLHLAAAAGDGSEFFHTTMAEADANLVLLITELNDRGLLGPALAAGDRCGLRPLHHAAIAGHASAARRLLACGADRFLTDSRGRTALDFAKQSGHAEVIRLLEHDT